MPYVNHVMLNEQRIDPAKVNSDERAVLQQWREQGHIEGGASGLAITREFWSAISNILWPSYVAYASCEGAEPQ